MLLTQEQLQDRLIALHSASLELVKDISLETLLERIAAVAAEQSQASYAALGVLNEEGKLKQFITVGMTEEQIRRIPHPPVGLGLIGALMDTVEPIRIPEIADDTRSAGFPPHHPHMQSFLGVPIRAGDRQLGQIYLTDKIDQLAFTADDEKIIQMLATYAAAAIQNARLYENLRERDITLTHRSEDLTLLNDIASALTSSLELDETLNRTLALVMNYLKVEAGEIFLLDEDKQTLRLMLHRGQAAEAFWTRNHFKMGEGIVGQVAESGQPMVSTDLARDMRYLREAVVKAGFRQMACLPLKSSEHLMGVLSVATRRLEPLDERSLQLLAAVGHWAGLAIENARLHHNVRRLAVLEERERIGMDLHDGVIQSIYAVGLVLENAYYSLDEGAKEARERIQQAIDDLNRTVRDIRAYILDLRPHQLDGEDLMGGLKRLVTEYRANTLSEAQLTGSEDGLGDMLQSHAEALFHICQEALANVAKHAEADHVTVGVWATPERILMEVRDDGRGFDLGNMNKTIGHGLANMLTRVRNVGGEVDITSAIGEGTTILAWVPRSSGHKSA
jgi:two-component system sensor histidine kinase DevS